VLVGLRRNKRLSSQTRTKPLLFADTFTKATIYEPLKPNRNEEMAAVPVVVPVAAPSREI
jgi:hypothetical protein